MNIRIVNSTNERGLVVSVQAPYPLSGEIYFLRECASKIERDLLCAHLRGALVQAFRDVRRTAYEMGWRDAKAKKRAKREFFTCSSSVEGWERKEAGL